MANTYKILGQITGSLSDQTVYTVPAATSAVVSTIAVANRSTSANSYRIGVVPSGDTLADENYIAYDVYIGGNDTATITVGVTLATGDFVQVYGNDTGSFSLFGTEIS
jgi:hypothetical protein